MSVSASIKFVQALNVGVPGVALLGVLATPVVATNGNDSEVVSWTWSWIDTPAGSLIPRGLIADGVVPSITFAPDARGGYLLELVTKDLAGNQARDLRTFQVAEASGYLIPPFVATDRSFNILGQTRGWAKALEELLRYLISGVGGGGSVAIAAYAIDWSLGAVFYKTLGAGAQVFTFANVTDGQTIVVEVTGAASTLTWPTVKWAGGVVPTQTASGTDVYTFIKRGANVFGSVVQAMA